MGKKDKEVTNMTLASELLHELKRTSKRWFIAFCIMCGLELATIGIFIWYITIPTEETQVEQDAEGSNYNIIDGGTINDNDDNL